MSKRKKATKGSDVWVALGTVFVLIGLWKLAERSFSPWWPSFARALNTYAGIVWPIALIISGVLVIYAVRSGRMEQDGKHLMRSQLNRRFAGVCGGFAELLGIDASIIRIVWVILAFVSFGIAVLAYLVCWAVIPLDAHTRAR